MTDQILTLLVIFVLSNTASAGMPGDQTMSSVFAFTGEGQPGNTTLEHILVRRLQRTRRLHHA
jgi:hypothetical protein